jgi:asparagine synthase (glutamine-hydrolysing)
MCGIAGYFSPQRHVETLAPLAAMLSEIRHRGPDDEGLLAIDRRRGARLELGRGANPESLRQRCPHDLGLAHCRFSIVDPSDAGHQPLWNDSRSLVLVYNGEVYNHPELRGELEKKGHRFRGGSDSEVVLRAFEEWDLDAFRRLNGFWALALYDVRRRRLVLSRDRIGKSPLYLGVSRGVLYFASEVKAILSVAGTEAFPVDEGAVADFVAHGWRDVDHGTFYRGIRTLENASTAVVDEDLGIRPVRYWRLPERRLEEKEIDLREAGETLRDVLADAVRIRLRADVPLAMELSGGLDSSSLVALRASSTEAGRFPVYTVKFDAPEADEEPLARLVASRWVRRVDYRVIRPPLLEFWEHADHFTWLMGEPFHSPNVLTTHRVRHRIRADGYKVIIAGSGGDEILAGYPHEYAVPFLASLLRTGTPLDIARELASATAGQRRALARRCLLGASRRPKVHPELAALIPARGRVEGGPPVEFEALLRAHWGPWKMNHWLRAGNPAQYGIPIESRAPFMDYRVAELAFQLPTTYLIRHGLTKYVLRRALEPLLPPPVVWRRRKTGYPFPWRDWISASKPWILANTAGSTLACVAASGLAARYDALAREDPKGLWRLASVLLWHRRCNEGRALAQAGPASDRG